MPRTARAQSESGYYHIVSRGVGKRLLFEDDLDREFFVELARKLTARYPIKLISWVLMDNHYHILCNADLGDLKRFMSSLNTSYSQHFNGTHGHVGHVFQGRYSSFAIDDDSYLLDVIRYIHLNPLGAGISDLESYPWSSYSQYLGNSGICNLDEVREILGSVEEIKKLHDASSADELVSLNKYRERLSDTEALALAKLRFGSDFSDRITCMERHDRDEMICRLYDLGLSEPQIVRLTGLGRGVVYRARKKVASNT